jgi:hypothetical protein
LEEGIKNLDIILSEKYANKSYKILEPLAVSTIDVKIAVTFIHSFVENLEGVSSVNLVSLCRNKGLLSDRLQGPFTIIHWKGKFSSTR